MNWFLSDTHAFHKNICRGTSSWLEGFRDFDTPEQMTKVLADNINAVVQSSDVIWHVGDWSFGGYSRIKEFRDMINCNTINLIFGNHDENIIRDKNKELRKLFNACWPVWEGTIEGKYIVLHHYSMRVWNHSHDNSWHLYGHSHGSLPDDNQSLSIDIGMDTKWYGSKRSDRAFMTTNFDKFHYFREINGVRTKEVMIFSEANVFNDVIHERFTPYNMDELSRIMKYKNFRASDHHTVALPTGASY